MRTVSSPFGKQCQEYRRFAKAAEAVAQARSPLRHFMQVSRSRVRSRSSAYQPRLGTAFVERDGEAARITVSCVATLCFSLVHAQFLVPHHSIPISSVPHKDAIPGGECGDAFAVRNFYRWRDFAYQRGERDRGIQHERVARYRDILRGRVERYSDIQLGSRRLDLARKPLRGSSTCACACACARTCIRACIRISFRVYAKAYVASCRHIRV